MKIKLHQELETLRAQLMKIIDDENIVNQIIVNSSDNIIRHTIDEIIRYSTDKEKLIQVLVDHIVFERRYKQKQLKTKTEILKMFKFPKQKFEELVRKNFIPHIAISQKIRLFDPHEVYQSIAKYKVDDLISSKIPPAALLQFLKQYE